MKNKLQTTPAFLSQNNAQCQKVESTNSTCGGIVIETIVFLTTGNRDVFSQEFVLLLYA